MDSLFYRLLNIVSGVLVFLTLVSPPLVYGQGVPVLSLEFPEGYSSGPFSAGDQVVVDLKFDPAGLEILNADVFIQIDDGGLLEQNLVLDSVELVDSELTVAPGLVEIVSNSRSTDQIALMVIKVVGSGAGAIVEPITQEVVIVRLTFTVADEVNITVAGLRFLEGTSLIFTYPVDVEPALNNLTLTIIPSVPTPTSMPPTPIPTEIPFIPGDGSPLVFFSFGSLATAVCESQVYPECELPCTTVPVFKRCLNLNQFLNLAISWSALLAVLVSLVRLAVGTFGYISSTGDAKKMEEARMTMIYAVLGLMIIAVVWLFIVIGQQLAPASWQIWFGGG